MEIIRDFGAGTGLLTLHLQPQVGTVVAMDSSRGMLEVLKKCGADSPVGGFLKPQVGGPAPHPAMKD